MTVIAHSRISIGVRMTFTANTRGDREVSIIYENSKGVRREILVPIVSPSMVERSTGTFREPEMTADLSSSYVSEIASLEQDSSKGPVVGLLVHTVSRRAVAIGAFSSADAANVWWSQPFNKLAKNREIAFVLGSVLGAASF